MNAKEIAAEAFVSYRHISSYLKHMIDEKLIYICAYRRIMVNQYDVSMAYYKAGNKKSVPKPPPLTAAERAKRIRGEIYKDEDKHNAYLKTRRINRKIKAIKVKPDWTTSWITRTNFTSGQQEPT